MAQRTELDWLICNEPLTYAMLILTGEIVNYLKKTATHGPVDQPY